MAIYVVGFLFTTDMNKVLLIEKKRPDWQRGKLNGIGGKVETSEDFQTALAREFAEETTLRFDGWKFFCTLHIGLDKGPDAHDVYFAAATSGMVDLARSPTDEKVFLVRVDTIEHNMIALGWPMEHDGGGERAAGPVLYNLPWLVRMAIDSLVNDVRYGVAEQR